VPASGLAEGFTMVADFRRGSYMPLTHWPGEVEMEVIKKMIEDVFMPIVRLVFRRHGPGSSGERVTRSGNF
jgi:hypothetical protein